MIRFYPENSIISISGHSACQGQAEDERFFKSPSETRAQTRRRARGVDKMSVLRSKMPFYKKLMPGMLQKLICNILFVYRYIGSHKRMSSNEYREIENPGVVWRGRSPSKCNPQQRPVRCEEHFCEAEHALREQKCFPCAFSARESRRDERKRRFSRSNGGSI